MIPKKSLCNIIVLTFVAALVASVAAAQAPGDTGSASLSTASASLSRTVVLDSLPQISAPTRRIPIAIPDNDEHALNTSARQLGVQPSRSYAPSGKPSLPVAETPGLTESYIGEDESGCGFFIPSDQAFASANLYTVQVLNSCIDIHNAKTGVRFSGYPKSLNTFFGVGGDLIGDPRAMFDWFSQRFIVVAEDFTANTFLVAASAGQDPRGGWFIYDISANSGGLTGSADFPMVGQTFSESGDSKGAIYLSWDRFGSGGFVDNVVWILPKTPILSGGGFGFNFFFNLIVNGKTVDHVQPVDVMSRDDEPRSEFLVNTFDFNFGCPQAAPCNGLTIWAIHNGVPASGQSVTLNGVVIGTVNNYAQPVTAAQPGAPSGTACAINPGFVGISSTPQWSAGDIYAATTTGALNGQATDGWIVWQIHPYLNGDGTINTAVLRDEHCQGCGGFGDNNFSEYYPAVQPDDEGNITVVFNASGASTDPSLAIASRRSTQIQNTFPDSGVYMQVGSAAYCQIDNSGRNRWGDYTATSPYGETIANHPAFWFAGQFSEANGNWGTFIGKNGYTNVGQP